MKHKYLLNRPIWRLRKKTVRAFLAAVITTIMFVGCNFLDYNESDQMEKEDIFDEFLRVKSVLSDIYSYLPTDFLSIDGATRSSASDDAIHEWSLSDIHKFNDGSWSPLVTLDDVWGNYYAAIRTANLFLEEIEGQTFENIKWNLDYDEIMHSFHFFPYEARALRAFFYFELAKRYGDVPLILNPLDEDEANMASRTSFDNVINFIVDECNAIVDELPVTHDTEISMESGRVTKGMAMALKARALLYAASPLHNPNNDKAKWVLAARAAKELMDALGANYLPLPTYTNAFNTIATANKEMIFERRPTSMTNTWEAANTAIGFEGGNTGTCPSQNLVDSYEMIATGLGINEAGSGYNAANPYVGRDPRMSATILFNGSTWKGQSVEVWNGGLNAPPKSNATKTGYYLKKYMVESISLNPVTESKQYHYFILFRYAEVLLNYAEAMNEAYGPEVNGTTPCNDYTALQAVNVVRARAGMPDFPTGMSQNDFRTKLRNERRVELAFEDHRFWDIRRWQIAGTDDVKIIRGIDIVKNSETLTYTPKIVETRIWNDKMNFYPIAQKELYKNKNLTQNANW